MQRATLKHPKEEDCEKELLSMQENPKIAPPTANEEPLSEELIRRRAFELYEARGHENGHELDDWLKAESELAKAA